MPVMDGFEACRQLKSHERTQHVPVLLLSATFMDSEAQVEGLETGADAYLTQPVEAPVLAATVRSLLRARRAESDVRQAALQWRTTFDAISDAVAVLDARRRAGAHQPLVRGRVRRRGPRGARRPPAGGAEPAAAGASSRPAAAASSRPAGASSRSASTRSRATPSSTIDAQVVLTLSDVTAARRAETERAAALARERTISRTLQQSLLPERLPRHPGLRLDAWHIAAEKELIIGGDWYDVIETGDSIWLVIGDVAGHGVAAATQAGQLRHSLRVYAHEGFGLSEAIRRLNELVIGTQLTGMATMCIASLCLDTGELRLVRAGHPPPAADPRRRRARAAGGQSGRRARRARAPSARSTRPRSTSATGWCSTPTASSSGPTTASTSGLARLVDAARGHDGLHELRAGIVRELVDATDLRDDVALLLAERV